MRLRTSAVNSASATASTCLRARCRAGSAFRSYELCRPETVHPSRWPASSNMPSGSQSRPYYMRWTLLSILWTLPAARTTKSIAYRVSLRAPNSVHRFTSRQATALGTELCSHLEGQITAYAAELCSPAPEPSPRPTASDIKLSRELADLSSELSPPYYSKYCTFFP
jgi:hypothetical protein